MKKRRMPYKTYAEQVLDHLKFLQSKGLDVDELQVDDGFVRCHTDGESRGRGELVYKTTSSHLDNGLVGLGTWCRLPGGDHGTFQTYGLGPTDEEIVRLPIAQVKKKERDDSSFKEAAAKAYGFWTNSSISGKSDYLDRKGVGYYGIRFREGQYGNVAVVPMYDIDGWLWNYQLLNPDGLKRDCKGGRIEGLFQSLGYFSDSSHVGVAESYVTAATCMENTGISCICCFGCNNIKNVITALADRYPKLRFTIFADNDRHLDQNQGVLKAQEVCKIYSGRVSSLAIPNFDGIQPSKEASDWNDLVRLKGQDIARSQMLEALRSAYFSS